MVLFHGAFVASALVLAAQVLTWGFVGSCAVQCLLVRVWGVGFFFFYFFFFFLFLGVSTSSGKMGYWLSNRQKFENSLVKLKRIA